MIKAVIFDYFGVIATDNYWHDAHVAADSNGSTNELHEAVEELDSGKISWNDFCAHIAPIVGETAKNIDIKAHQLKLNKDLIAYAFELKGRGIKLGLLSNASSGFLMPIIDQFKLGELFDEIVVSSEIGASKPHPKIYQTILGNMGVEAFECIFIDDIQGNVHGAENVGMYSLLFESNIQTQKSIEALLANTNN